MTVFFFVAFQTKLTIMITLIKFKVNIGFMSVKFSISNDFSFTNSSLTSIDNNGCFLSDIETLVISFSDTDSLFNKSKALSLQSCNVFCVFNSSVVDIDS